LDSGNYYEYSQFVKTIFFKYKMRRKYKEMKDLIMQSVVTLGQKEKQDLTCEVFEMYYKEFIDKMKKSTEDAKLSQDEFLFNLCEQLYKYGESNRAVKNLELIVETCFSSNFTVYNQKLCGIIGNF